MGILEVNTTHSHNRIVYGSNDLKISFGRFDLCTAGVVDVSGISGATAFFGTSTPTVGQIVNAVESKWTGKLTTNRKDWKWNLTDAQKDIIIKVVTGI